MVARVDNDGAVADPFATNELGFTDGANDDFGAADDLGEGCVVREWQMVTVALAASSIMAMGRPRMGLRPTTTASRPSMGIS